MDTKAYINVLERELTNNNFYIQQSKVCISIFNDLVKSIPERSRYLLLDYEEAVAYRELLLIDMLTNGAPI